MAGLVRGKPRQVLTPERSGWLCGATPSSTAVRLQLHAAAYRVLGLEWEYGRRRVSEAEFADALASLDGTWRGLSLTMPAQGRGASRLLPSVMDARS